LLYYYQDAIGSTTAVASQAGAVLGTFTYDSYGNSSASNAALAVPFLFAGQYTDSVSGLIYMRARWYDPSTGQFLSRDPLESASGSSYSYADDSPINLGDQAGSCPNLNIGPGGTGPVIGGIGQPPLSPTMSNGGLAPGVLYTSDWLNVSRQDFSVNIAGLCTRLTHCFEIETYVEQAKYSLTLRSNGDLYLSVQRQSHTVVNVTWETTIPLGWPSGVADPTPSTQSATPIDFWSGSPTLGPLFVGNLYRPQNILAEAWVEGYLEQNRGGSAGTLSALNEIITGLF
jgi:RHS repeat-associated protein